MVLRHAWWRYRLGVQVLLLVRDPRGTMQFCHQCVWCPGNPDCEDPASVCQDLVSDYNTAKKFLTISTFFQVCNLKHCTEIHWIVLLMCSRRFSPVVRLQECYH